MVQKKELNTHSTSQTVYTSIVIDVCQLTTRLQCAVSD